MHFVSRLVFIISMVTKDTIQTLYHSIILQESCQTVPRFCFPYDTQKWVSLYSFPFAGCFFFFMSTSCYIHLRRVRDGVAVQNFTFVLTDLEGSQRFGFCRLTTSTHNCLCILRYRGCELILMQTWAIMQSRAQHFPSVWFSYLPWFEVFYKLLNNLADYLKKGQVIRCCIKKWLALISSGCNHGHNVHISDRLMRWKHYWLHSTSSPYHWCLGLSLSRW